MLIVHGLRAARQATSNLLYVHSPSSTQILDSVTRSFTSAGSGVSASRRNPDSEFVVERRKYKEELHGLRKQFLEENALLTEGRDEEKKKYLAERQATIKAEKATRDVIKKQIAADNTILHQQFVEAKTEERAERREKSRASLQKVDGLRTKQSQMLEEKSATWVRETELEDRINEALDNPKRLV